VLVASVALLLALLLTGCPPPSASPTATPTPSGTATPTPSSTATPTPSSTATPTPSTPTGTELSYNALSPRGIALPVQTYGLAKRLTTLNDQMLQAWVNQGEADPIIFPAIWERVQKDFPKTNWHYIATSSFGPATPEPDVVSAADFVIRGNCW